MPDPQPPATPEAPASSPVFPAHAARPPASSIWSNAGFMLMWASVFAAGFGDRMIQLAAEPMLGVNVPGASAASISAAVQFFFYTPYLLLALVGGWLGDRLPRKWIMFACDQGRAVILLLAWWWAAAITTGALGVIPEEHHWKIYAVMALTGGLAAMFNPAKYATVPELVREDHLQQANAVLAGIGIIASLVGFGVGGFLVKHHLRESILLGAACYFVGGLCFTFMKPARRRFATAAGGAATHHAHPAGGALAQLAESFRYLLSHRAVRNLVLLNILFWSASWVLNAAIAAMVKTHYGLPPADYVTDRAVMMAAIGVGIIVASGLMLLVKTQREAGLLASCALAVAALAMIAFAFNRWYWVGVFLIFLTGLFGGVFLIAVDALTQALTPNRIRSRIFGLRSSLDTVTTIAINLAIWRLPNEQADNLMVPLLLITAGILAVVALGGAWQGLTRGPMPTRFANFLWRSLRIYTLLWHRVRWVGKHHVPASGPVLLASNHTTAIDTLVIQGALPRIIRWVMNKDYATPMLGPVWKVTRPILVEQGGKDTQGLRNMIRELQERELVGIFPEGRLQRAHRELAPFEPGIGLLARKSAAPVIPVWIHGSPQSHSMLSHFLTPSHTVVCFGEPFLPGEGMSNAQVAEELRRRMTALGEQASRM